MDKVSVIIPFRDKPELLNDCLQSMATVLGRSANQVEVVLVNNRSTAASLEQIVVPKSLTSTRVDADVEFNFQHLINLGVAHSTGSVLLLLNNDIVFTKESKGFLEAMRKHALAPETGAVGCLLTFPDGTIQHAGVVVGMNQYADHLYRGWTFEEAAQYPFHSPTDDRFVSAVTAALLMIERKKYLEVGGMDERFIVCGGDVDLCARLVQRGFKNVYLGSIQAVHLESKSRDPSRIPESDFQESTRAYSEYLAMFGGRDPYYPEPLSLRHTAPTPAPAEAAVVSTERTLLQRVSTTWDLARQEYRTFRNRFLSEPPEFVVAEYTRRFRKQILGFEPRIGRKRPSGIEAPPENRTWLTPDNFRNPHTQPLRLHDEFPLAPRPRLNLLVPHLVQSGIYGGITTAALVAMKFRCKYDDVDLRVVLTDGPGDAATFKRTIERYFPTPLDLPIAVIPAYDRAHHSVSIHSRDVFMATAWWTCFPAAKAMPGRRFLYLIQDFEPGFYPWGEDYAGALNSYSLDFVPLFNTTCLRDFFLLRNLLPKSVVDQGASFEPAISPVVLDARRKRKNSRRKKRLFFYGRRSVARNLFSTGVLALEQAIQERTFDPAEWEFLSAGEAHTPISLGRGAVLRSLGKLSMEAYGNMLSETDIGLSLMLSPHPSYPPLEIAAAGAICVTNGYENKDLGSQHPDIVSCAPSPEAVAEGLRLAVQRMKSPKRTQKPLESDWDRSLEEVLAKIHEVTLATA